MLREKGNEDAEKFGIRSPGATRYGIDSYRRVETS